MCGEVQEALTVCLEFGNDKVFILQFGQNRFGILAKRSIEISCLMCFWFVNTKTFE